MRKFIFHSVKHQTFKGLTSPIQIRFSTTQHQDSRPKSTISPAQTANGGNFEYYSSLRIYKNHSWNELMNLIFMTSLCSNQHFVDNSRRIYDLCHKVFGSTLTDYTIAKTIGRIFTAGDTLETMEKFIDQWRYPNINLLICYSNEIALGQAAVVEELDKSAEIYAQTVNLAAKTRNDNSGIALKCSCLCPPKVIKKANEAQLKLRSIFSKGYGNLSQTLTAQQLYDKLHQLKLDFTFEDFQEFISLFLNKEVNKENFSQLTVSKFEWLKDVYAFNLNNSNKNTNKILRQLTCLTDEDIVEFERFAKRLNLVFERAKHFKCTVLIDAEQTYYQETLDMFAMQFSSIYNKDHPILLNTFQNYLKVTKDKLLFEIERCKALNIPLGIKMVRGAYMVEERNLAKKHGYEDPIHDTLEDTHDNYNGNIEYLFANWIPRSKVLVASHNENSVRLAKDLIEKYNINSSRGNVSFAQLLGIGDHLTFTLADQKHSVAKLVCFGPVPIMIPFFVRRAQETKQMFTSTGLLRRLALKEISMRLRNK